MQLGLIFTQTSKFMYDTLEGQEERKESVLKVAKRERNVLLQSSHNSQKSQNSQIAQTAKVAKIWFLAIFA